MTCGGHFPPLRLADFPVASTASSTTSRGTQDASTPREIQSLKRVPATSTVCVITRDQAHNQPERPGATRRADQDQLRLSGIVGVPGAAEAAHPVAAVVVGQDAPRSRTRPGGRTR